MTMLEAAADLLECTCPHYHPRRPTSAEALDEPIPYALTEKGWRRA